MKTCTTAIISLILASGCSLAGEPLRSRSEIETIVREYILRHPEVLMESVRSYQERQRAEQQQQARNVIASHSGDLLTDPSSPTAGKGAGKTPIVMFFDYRCGYCKRMDESVLALSADGSGAYVIFKELPILGAESAMASSAALAAQKQGAYLEFHRTLMSTDEPVTMPLLERIASKLSLDTEKLKRDMQSAEVGEALARNQQLAAALGIRATPSFVIGGDLIAGGMDPSRLQALVATARTQEPGKN